MQTREQWLTARRYDVGRGGWIITASDVAAILGWDPRQNRRPLDVFETKLSGREIEQNDAMRNGICMEPGIVEIYLDETGRVVVNPGATKIQYHPDLPWLGSTPDRWTWKIDCDTATLPGSPLEIKWVQDHRKVAAFDDGACPLWLQIQLQIQIACCSAEWGSWAAMIPSNPPFRWGDLDRNSDFIDSTIPRLEEFRWRLDNNKPPAPESPRDLEPIKRLYPLDNGETIHLAREHLELANSWEGAKEARKEADEERAGQEALLRSVMGEATFGVLCDGTLLTLETKTKKDGSQSRTLRRTRI